LKPCAIESGSGAFQGLQSRVIVTVDHRKDRLFRLAEMLVAQQLVGDRLVIDLDTARLHEADGFHLLEGELSGSGR